LKMNRSEIFLKKRRENGMQLPENEDGDNCLAGWLGAS
jgi:hypothetical protein